MCGGLGVIICREMEEEEMEEEDEEFEIGGENRGSSGWWVYKENEKKGGWVEKGVEMGIMIWIWFVLIWVFLWVCFLGFLFFWFWFGDGFWLWKYKLFGECLKEEIKKKRKSIVYGV